VLADGRRAADLVLVADGVGSAARAARARGAGDRTGGGRNVATSACSACPSGRPSAQALPGDAAHAMCRPLSAGTRWWRAVSLTVSIVVQRFRARSWCLPPAAAREHGHARHQSFTGLITYFDYCRIMESPIAAFAFAALGQETRLDLLRMLLAAGPSGLAAGDIAARLGVAPSTLSFHLRALDQAGLIAATRQGRSLIYAAQVDRLRALLTFLADACCDGDPARCGDLHDLFDTPRETARMKPATFNVLFLCTRNSARSIMAEAILNGMADGRFRAFSAGSDPLQTGPLPEVLGQLKSLGHDVSGLRSKSWNEFTGPGAPRMDFVIALCDTLNLQACPDFEGTHVTAAWPLPDPAKFAGTAAERATLLNELYAALHRRLGIFTSLPFGTLDRMALKARLDELAQPLAAGARA
jgi:arsenate reductase